MNTMHLVGSEVPRVRFQFLLNSSNREIAKLERWFEKGCPLDGAKDALRAVQEVKSDLDAMAAK